MEFRNVNLKHLRKHLLSFHKFIILKELLFYFIKLILFLQKYNNLFVTVPMPHLNIYKSNIIFFNF